MLKLSEQNKKKELLKKLFLQQRFYTIKKQKFSNLTPLLVITFPHGFQKSKSLDIGLWEGGAKRPLNGVNKV